MELVTKPDLDEVKQRWRAFWAGEVLDRAGDADGQGQLLSLIHI